MIQFTLESKSEASKSEVELPDQLWRNRAGVSEARCEVGRYQLSVVQPHVVIPLLLQGLDSVGRRASSLTTRQASLEDVFVKVAGRTLEEAEGEPA